MMKKIITITFCILMLFSLLLSVGTVMAAEPGYERFSRPTVVIPTIDGQWTSLDEWTDGEETWIGTDVVFRSTWDNPGDDVYTRWIVEFLTDTTDDPGDLWLFCIDGEQSGSSGNVRKFEITGHTELTWYLKIGASSWTVYSLTEDEIEWANSLSASPTSSTPHWILEFQIPKNTGQVTMSYIWNFLLQASDASNPTFHAWPPTDPDNADTWGIENYSTEAIPEGLTFAVMASLTTVSMLVGYRYFVKRKETKIR
jgi:hypothetical protein